jgi:hypothetical protein
MRKLPSLVRGRRGKSSVIDCLTLILWERGRMSQPSYSFAELTERVSELRGSPVAKATIQSIIYRRAEWFERTRSDDGGLRWKLSPGAKMAVESRRGGASPSAGRRGKPANKKP